MKCIGLLGGMSWRSTAIYYRLLNEAIAQRLGGLASARLVMISENFAEIEAMQRRDDWAAAGRLLAQDAARLQAGGADCVLICTNTMHKVADQVAAAINIPLLHLIDETATRVRAAGIQRVALLGTRFTMEQTFYRQRLQAQGLEVLTPEPRDRQWVDQVIFEQLCVGDARADARAGYLRVIQALRARGAQAVIAGCTEISLLIGPDALDCPYFDTTAIHAQAAVSFALAP